MFVCAFWVCNKKTTEFFEDTSLETQVMQVYSRVLQRQPTSKELSDAVAKLKSEELTISQIEGRLMDSDEYQRTIKLQSNALTPELDKMVHERKQLAHVADLYFAALTKNIPPAVLMPLRDVYIYLEYSDAAFTALLSDPKFEAYEKRLTNEFQLSKEKTIAIFDETFSKDDLMRKAKDMKSRDVQSNVHDPPIVVRAYDKVEDSKPVGEVQQVIVVKTAPVVPAKEGFQNYTPENAPSGSSLEAKVYRTVNDRDSDSSRSIFDIEQRSKNIFDIHALAKRLDDSPDAFVYLPTIPVRYESPAQHFDSKPPSNNDPFVTDLFGCSRGAPVTSI